MVEHCEHALSGNWDNSGLLTSDWIFCMSEHDSMETLTFYLYSANSTLTVNLLKLQTCYLVLSIHIAENAMTMILTTCSALKDSSRLPQISQRLRRILFTACSRLSRNFRRRRSACYKSRPFGWPAKSAAYWSTSGRSTSGQDHLVS